MDRLVQSGVRMYSQGSKDKALGMLRLTGDVEKTARMSGVPGRTLRRWAAAAAKPRQRSRGAKFEPYGDEVRGKAMEMARGGASCREIAEALGIGSPDVVRCWLKGGGTKEARMGGRARTPEGDEPAYAGFGGGLEERIRRLELENDIPRGAVDLLKAGSLGSMGNMEKTALIDKLRLESDRPLRELTDSLRISKGSYEYFRAGGPNELWLTDITEFKLPSEEKAYLSPVIDCFDGLVVSRRIGRRPNAALANGSLEDACGTLAPGQRPVCHSDGGCHCRWPG